jgi:lipid A ethanolaminephosphotransferase
MCDEADQTIYMNGQRDGAMLEPLRKAIAADTSDLFVVLHSYGSHFNYRERYPDSFSHYTPDDDVSISKKNRERMVNAYDNSIVYTDWFLAELIGLLRNTNACSAMFYCADHGEDLYDDDRGRFLHSSPTISYYQAHVACLGWYSDMWQEHYPDKAAAAVANTMAPASTHSVFHTVAQLADIESKYIKDEVSLVSDDFDYSVERHYLDDHCNAQRYGDMGMREADWEQFTIKGITDL